MTARGILRDKDGSTIIEFALVLVPLLTLIMGSWEMGRQVYISSIVQGVLTKVARDASLENASQTALKTRVDALLSDFAVPEKITLTITSFKKFSSVGTPEKITTDTAPMGTYNVGDCYVDSNSNNTYDTASPGSAGIGSAEDAIRVKLGMEAKRLTPVGEWIGYGSSYTVERTTFVQIEPYAGTVDPPTRCT